MVRVTSLSLTITLLSQLPEPAFVPELAVNDGASDEIFTLINKLSELNKAGVLTDEEFGAKKSELLERL